MSYGFHTVNLISAHMELVEQWICSILSGISHSLNQTRRGSGAGSIWRCQIDPYLWSQIYVVLSDMQVANAYILLGGFISGHYYCLRIKVAASRWRYSVLTYIESRVPGLFH